MEQILKTIAKAYSERYKSLKGICFLFPNKRCSAFFKKYLADIGRLSEEMPHMLTISDFTSMVARKMEADKIIQLFTLFNAYKEIAGNQPQLSLGLTNNINETQNEGQNIPLESQLDFDSFRGWGETVLADFNTVDFYMADPDEIFKNVKDFREISANYLSDEQKEVMREYFGIEDFNDSGSFWKEFNTGKLSPLKERFLNLWQVLAPLHKKFLQELDAKGFGTAGSIYREAALKIGDKGKDILPYNKIVVVGFNALTQAERVIFKTLRDMKGDSGYDDFADFIWDSTGPILSSNDFSASKFVNHNKKHFPAPDWLEPLLEEQEVTNFPEIEIISASSSTAQAKIAGQILANRYSNKSDLNSDNTLLETALVLPDETLLPNVLFSIPDSIGDVNLTMGVSLRQAPVSSFMALVRRLYASARHADKKISLYSRDLRMLLSHPYSYILFDPLKVESLLDFIGQYHKVSISLDEAATFLPEAESLLSFPKKDPKISIFPFIFNILDALKEKIELNEENPDENQDYSYIKIYRQNLEVLQKELDTFKIESSPLSLMQLADRLIAQEKIGFEGEPLMGLQVMGTLETRALDFKNVIILSMNEGVMPRKSVSTTFIPESLRKAYGLPPARYAEEIFAYYFYRLLSRAEKVSLIYDGRTSSGLRGAESRYILQLRHFAPKDKIRESVWQYSLQERINHPANIVKTPEILDELKVFLSSEPSRKNLSASSLNTYRECQVRFFLQNIKNINSDPEKGEFMDPIAIGNVLHHVMMELYLPRPADRERLLTNPVIISSDTLENILAHPQIIKNLVVRNIREFYYGSRGESRQNSPKDVIPDSGVVEIIANQIVGLIEEIVRYDLQFVPFRLYGCEIAENMRVKLKSGREVNFRFAIDRLDAIKVDGKWKLRIIDYKTGKRKRKAASLKEMFSGSPSSQQIFQLFTYAWLLGKLNSDKIDRGQNPLPEFDISDVITEIYFVPDIVKGKRGLPQLGKEMVKTYSLYAEDFDNGLQAMVDSIFDSPVFSQAEDTRRCDFCPFRSLCNR